MDGFFFTAVRSLRTSAGFTVSKNSFNNAEISSISAVELPDTRNAFAITMIKEIKEIKEVKELGTVRTFGTIATEGMKGYGRRMRYFGAKRQ